MIPENKLFFIPNLIFDSINEMTKIDIYEANEILSNLKRCEIVITAYCDPNKIDVEFFIVSYLITENDFLFSYNYMAETLNDALYYFKRNLIENVQQLFLSESNEKK